MFWWTFPDSDKENARARRWLRPKAPQRAAGAEERRAALLAGYEEGASPRPLAEMLWNDYAFFSEMTRAETEEFLRACHRRFFGPGMTLFREGEPAAEFYFIVFGEFVLRQGGAETALLGAGELLGAAGVLLGRRTATAQTRKSTLVLSLPREAVLGGRTKLSPPLARKVRKLLSAHLRRPA